ncbi:cell division protein ZapE [Pelagibacterales bacterium SAG-MED20]|nr:cell division protein ZapE [Pelagibacterales bacterium SAG-MED20]
MNLKKLFINYCNVKKLEINNDQVKIIESLNKFYNINFKNSFLSNLLSKKNNKQGFYLQGGVGVGKTMILDFFYKNFNKSKQRLHFNEFMINFHDFVFQKKNDKKENVINRFVNELKKKYELIYFDEFQVTNIVDAMILGNLFKKIFDKNIKVIFSSNIKINDLYKDGLQREQFLPFIMNLKLKCYEENLIIKEDYRKSKKNKSGQYFYPLNDATNFKINKLFRQLTKGKIREDKILSIKGRKFNFKNYYQGIARFDFNDLCNKNIGAEDYIKIAKVCDFIIIENLPNFNYKNSNQQQRFITLIDIIYEKKISLVVSGESSLQEITSVDILKNPFKRTTSRLYELTSLKYDYL